jgi:hypothetical protein
VDTDRPPPSPWLRRPRGCGHRPVALA